MLNDSVSLSTLKKLICRAKNHRDLYRRENWCYHEEPRKTRKEARKNIWTSKEVGRKTHDHNRKDTESPQQRGITGKTR